MERENKNEPLEREKTSKMTLLEGERENIKKRERENKNDPLEGKRERENKK